MRGLLLGAAVAFAVSCAWTGPWPRRDAFFADVRCDLSIDAVHSLARRHGGEGWICHSPGERSTECSFSAGRTRVTLEFEEGKARTIEDGDQFGITGMAMRPRSDLCSGARSRAMMIVPGHESWIGAVISVDGREIGTVTTGHPQNLYVPVGRVVLKVTKAGRDPISVEVSVPDGTVRNPPMLQLP